MGRYSRDKKLEGVANPRHLDGEDLALMRLPANRETEFLEGKILIDVKSPTAGAEVELVELTSGDIWAKGATDGADDSTVELAPQLAVAGTSSYPITVAASATERRFALRLNLDAGAAAKFSAFVRYWDPGTGA